MRTLKLTALSLSLMALSAIGVRAQAPANDACSGAISLTSSFGQAANQVIITGPYDNTNATHHATDPTNGFQCFGEGTAANPAPSLENTLWFSFVGDGGLYFIETGRCNPALPASTYIDFGDTQIAIYTGTCGNLTPVACNEDGPSSTSTTYPAGLNLQTVAGTTYYMMIDGYLDGSTPSLGQFCINVKKVQTIACTDPSVTPGVTTASTMCLEAGQVLTVTASGVVAPTVGAVSGISWVITNADISGSTNPLQNPALIASYVVTSPAPSVSTRTLTNNGTLIGSANLPYGVYYWTPVVFGNATQSTPGTAFLSNHTLDPNCTFVGQSIMVDVKAPGTTCTTGVPANDACSGAISLTSSFGQAANQVIITGPYDNTLATHHATDPTNGFECFGEGTAANPAPSLENTLWFSFVGDGGLYFIETGRCNPALPASTYIDFGDTQIAIYTGTCGNLTPVACNEDGPSSTSTTYPAGLNLQTVAGTTYYMMIDGYLDGSTPSLGQFCINVKKVQTIACTDPSVTPGVTTASSQCITAGQVLTVTASGVVAPTVGAVSGVSWVITNADISGSTNPLQNPALIASYVITSPAPAVSTRTLTNNGTLIGTANIPYGTYYWTPVVFGNATQTTPGTAFLSAHTLDPSCTVVGQSIAVQVVAPGSPCLVGLAEDVNGGFAIKGLYPVPVQNMLNLQFTAGYNTSVTVAVKDLLGREITSSKVNAAAGDNNYSLDMSNEAAGVYFVTVSNGKHQVVSKFVKE